MSRLRTIAGRPVSERPYETTHRTERHLDPEKVVAWGCLALFLIACWVIW